MRNNSHCQLLIAFLLLCITFISVIHSGSLFAMDLVEAYIRAKDHDPLFGSAFYEHEAAATLPAQGRSFLLPEVRAYGTGSEYYYDSAPDYYRDFRSQSMGVSLKQPIFSISRYYEYRQHTIRKNIGDEQFASSEQNFILRLTEAYCRGLAAGSLLALVDAEKKTVKEQREQAKRMFQAGVATITDIHDAEARFDSVLAQEIEAKNNLDINMLALKKIVGVETVLNPLRENISLGFPDSDNLEEWINRARKNHPILKSYAFQIAYQEAELKKAQGQHWPNLDLVAAYDKTNTNDNRETQRLSYSSVGIQVNVPVFSGGYTRAKVRETRAVLNQARLEYEKNLANIIQKVSEAFLGIQANFAKIDALRTANASASSALDSNKKSLIAGVRTTIDVLNAERERQRVRGSLIQARYDCLLNIVRLKAHAGTLSDKDVYAMNEWLQTK